MDCQKKKLIKAIFLSIIFLPLAAAGKVEVFVTPQPVRAGEEAYLVVRSDDGTRNLPLSRRLPKIPGLDWQNGIRQSSQTRIINGKRSSVFEAYIPFVVSRPGSYTIPSMNLSHSKERTRKITFDAVEARYRTGKQSETKRISSDEGNTETGLTPEQIMFMELEIPARKPYYYLGEEIPVEINIYVLEGARPQLSWPKLDFGEKSGAVFRDYRQTNPENPNFAGMTQRQTERNGRVYTVCSFRTAIRPISAGKLEITGHENAALIVRDNRRRTRSSDPFFDEFFNDSFFSRNRQIARNMTTPPLVLDIHNLPPVPEGTRFTGLVGHWESQITLSPPPYKVGEPITLKVEFQGSGSTDTLRSWPLDLKGFRVYPPEVEKNAGSAEIRYVLIPTEPSDGKTENICFGPYAIFNAGKYQIKEFKRPLMIEKGSAVIPGNAGSYSEEAAAPTDAPGTEAAPLKRKSEDILYLKKSAGRTVPLPPEINIAGGILVILAGAVFLIAVVIVRLIRRARENDPDYQRKSAARAVKPELLSRLKRLDPEEIPEVCSGEIASFLADMKGLAPGSDLSECAESLRGQSPELAKMLDELSQAAWMPSMKSKFTPEFRKALIKALGKIAVLMLIFASGSLSAAEKITTQSHAMNAYDAGKFDAAEKFYRSIFNPAEPSANLLYNIGNCLFQQGYWPQAMICYERASRLSPRDPDVLENLNLTRRKLMLPEKYKVESPSDIPPYLRDSLRPDEWLFLLCCGIALIFVASGVAVLRGNCRLFRILLIAGVLLIALPATAYFSQRATSYNPDFAIVTAKNLPVYSLPSDQAGKVEIKLRAGEEVTIMERRLDWIRIRSGATEGWVHAKAITSLWSPHSAGDI
ncbi:MAG: BatD family protein [Lentisphaeria bacterium]|nr:BatD family protein [Lentisphaeria bacterium]